MWRDLEKLAPTFDSGVLSGIDTDGYPTSTRVRFTLDPAGERLYVQVPAGAAVPAGPASLLLHYFNEKLWDLRSYMVRGRLLREGDEWLLVPEQYTPGMSQSPRAFFTFVRTARRRANAYLKKRNLPRPAIPWDDINRIKKQTGI
jgi:hypothetical protein